MTTVRFHRTTRSSGAPNHKPEVYTLGHRNSLGLAVHPVTGDMWQSEMGPNGGDKINILKPGANYGWPLVSLGRSYPGPWQSPTFSKEGFEAPVVYWMPSISLSGMTFYTGDKLPKWKGDIFVGGQRTGEIPGTGHLERVLLNEKLEELRREALLVPLQMRIRDVRQGPMSSSTWWSTTRTVGFCGSSRPPRARYQRHRQRDHPAELQTIAGRSGCSAAYPITRRRFAMLDRQRLIPRTRDDLMRLGLRRDGGYVVPAAAVERTAVLLSLGVRRDWSFEKAFAAANRAVRVIGVDPSVGPRFFARRLATGVVGLMKSGGFNRRTRKHHGAMLRNALDYFWFFVLRHRHIGVSVADRDDAGHVTIGSLVTLAAETDHRVFLKMDIEGGEYGIVPDIVEHHASINCVVAEFHRVGQRDTLFNEGGGDVTAPLRHRPSSRQQLSPIRHGARLSRHRRDDARPSCTDGRAHRGIDVRLTLAQGSTFRTIRRCRITHFGSGSSWTGAFSDQGIIPNSTRLTMSPACLAASRCAGDAVNTGELRSRNVSPREDP
jgi:hypothetical protein